VAHMRDNVALIRKSEGNRPTEKLMLRYDL
jgi:hypothetical protein